MAKQPPKDPAAMFAKLGENREVRQAKPPAAQPIEPEPQRRGRAKGKRSDPNFTQVGAYIPKSLDRQVKKLLIDRDIDFSDLVGQLLEEWVNQQTD